jgi:hypothetical protein
VYKVQLFLPVGCLNIRVQRLLCTQVRYIPTIIIFCNYIVYKQLLAEYNFCLKPYANVPIQSSTYRVTDEKPLMLYLAYFLIDLNK